MKIAVNVQGKGTPWVFIHGWGMHKSIWRPVTDTLHAQTSTPVQTLTLDLPGFGRSGWQTNLAQFDAMVDAVESCLATQVSAPLYLVGWSMGGLIAQALALRENLSVNGLVLVASTPKFTEAEQWPGIQARVLAMFQKQLKLDFSATIARFLAVQAMGSPQTREDIRTIQQLLADAPPPHPEALAAGLAWLEQVDLRRAFSAITCPTMRIYGKRDSLVPVKQCERIDKENDSALVYEQSAHTPFLNELPRFVADLLAFGRRTQTH